MEFRDASEDQLFAELYLSKILEPGLRHATERAGLLAATCGDLAGSRALVGLGCEGATVVGGLYITVDQAGTAWLHGVRVAAEYRNRGHGSDIVRRACAFMTEQFGITRFALTVRCDGNGMPYDKAFLTYLRCGFVPVSKPYQVLISGSRRDKHLGRPGAKFMAIDMEA